MGLSRSALSIPLSIRLAYATAVCKHLALSHKWDDKFIELQAISLATGDWGAGLSDAVACQTDAYLAHLCIAGYSDHLASWEKPATIAGHGG